jgi:hypothetical protein
MTLFPAACGEKKRVTSSSKKVRPVAPRRKRVASEVALAALDRRLELGG